jgi:hypothetical protein
MAKEITSKAASVSLMEELHSATATAMLDEMQGYRDRGEPVPAALLGAITKFLKDNKIEAVAVAGSPVRSLADTLPFPSDTQLYSVK